MSASQLTTRERILGSGANLLSKSGLGGVTVGALAELTGMSKSGLFAHFGSKDELQISLLERSTEIAGRFVVGPAMAAPEGLPRLKALVQNWLGWSKKAGLDGGCPVAAGLFELDDSEGPVRDRLLQMEKTWRDLLVQLVRRAMELDHLRKDLDVDQFVWELCGIYLSHHASARFVRDRKADARAGIAFDALLVRALPAVETTKQATRNAAHKRRIKK
jgi:AcrR family transcriptional regulator